MLTVCVSTGVGTLPRKTPAIACGERDEEIEHNDGDFKVLVSKNPHLCYWVECTKDTIPIDKAVKGGKSEDGHTRMYVGRVKIEN